jgi:hypothetical protein
MIKAHQMVSVSDSPAPADSDRMLKKRALRLGNA